MWKRGEGARWGCQGFLESLRDWKSITKFIVRKQRLNLRSQFFFVKFVLKNIVRDWRLMFQRFKKIATLFYPPQKDDKLKFLVAIGPMMVTLI